MLSIVIAGRLGKDSELRRTQSGKPVLGFTVAVDAGYGESKQTLWFDASLWGDRGKSLEPFMKKGASVTVSGTLGTREYDGKTRLTIDVNDVTLQGGKPQSDAPARKREEAALSFDDDGDTIPF